MMKNGFFCKSYTIDQIIYSMNIVKSVEFIKIDAEGAELEILKGSMRTLKDMKPILYLEITKDEKDIRELLFKHDYAIFHFLNGHLEALNEKLPYTSVVAKPLE